MAGLRTTGNLHMEDEYYPDQPGQKDISQRLQGIDDGFTLLELLISMTLLIIIIVLMMGAMRMGSRSVAAGEKKMEAGERFRSVIMIIDAQIQSHVPLTYEREGNKKYYFRGEPKALRFTTNYSIWGAQRGYRVLDYRVESDHSGKEIMTATEGVPGVEGHRDVRLIAASAISFEYFRKEPAEEKGRWVTSLVEEDIIPDKIRVHLRQGSKQLALIFPVRVGGEMISKQGGTPLVSNIPKGAPLGAK